MPPQGEVRLTIGYDAVPDGCRPCRSVSPDGTLTLVFPAVRWAIRSPSLATVALLGAGTFVMVVLFMWTVIAAANLANKTPVPWSFMLRAPGWLLPIWTLATAACAWFQWRGSRNDLSRTTTLTVGPGGRWLSARVEGPSGEVEHDSHWALEEIESIRPAVDRSRRDAPLVVEPLRQLEVVRRSGTPKRVPLLRGRSLSEIRWAIGELNRHLRLRPAKPADGWYVSPVGAVQGVVDAAREAAVASGELWRSFRNGLRTSWRGRRDAPGRLVDTVVDVLTDRTAPRASRRPAGTNHRTDRGN